VTAPPRLRDHPLARLLPEAASRRRHDRTQVAVKEAIGDALAALAPDARVLVEVGAETGLATAYYRDRLPRVARAVAVDWADQVADEARPLVEFARANVESEAIPLPDGSADAVVCNQVIEHLKNVFHAMDELARIVRPGGLLLLSTPNLAAAHNVALLALGRQPTTLAIRGSHVRGYAVRDARRFLAFNGHFRIVRETVFGLHPFTSAALPRPLATWGHTPLWALVRQESDRPTWGEARRATPTTTSFGAAGEA
jgi:SAM-dependent methyltransferase